MLGESTAVALPHPAADLIDLFWPSGWEAA